IRAPRLRAISYSSRISTPDPSPTMKPSRSLSKGRLARSGASLRVESARIAPNPPMPIGVMAASDPPAIMTSAAPRLMISNASPMACAEAEQAVQVAELGPLAPKRIDTWPAARLMMADGMKNGEILRGPPSRSALCSRSMVVNPPMPEAMKTPARGPSCGVIVSCASSTANCAAAIAYWMKMSIFLTSFFSTNCSGSKPLTSPAMRVANCAASNLVIVPTPLWPAQSAAQLASVPMPSDDTRPMPVTTTRRLLVIFLCSRDPAPPRSRCGARRLAFFVRTAGAVDRTRRDRAHSALLLRFGVRLDVLDRFFDAGDLLGVLVGDFDPELFLERHHQFDGVERVGTQIVDKRRVRRHLFFVDPELFHNDALHFVGYRHSTLLHVHPAVDGQNVPSNIRRFVRRKKPDRRRHVAGDAEPP